MSGSVYSESMSEPDENWPDKRERLQSDKDDVTKQGIFKSVPLDIACDFEDAVGFENALDWGRRKADDYALGFEYEPAGTEEQHHEMVKNTEERCLEEVVEFERKKRKLAQCIEHVDGRYKKLMEEQRVQLAIELFRSVSKH